METGEASGYNRFIQNYSILCYLYLQCCSFCFFTTVRLNWIEFQLIIILFFDILVDKALEQSIYRGPIKKRHA